MSDIRFNRWLHQSGTGGVSQDSSGNIGIGTTVPTMALDVRGDVNIGNTININNASGIISATTFTGTTGTFSGDVTVGGTLTYEDVSNIDAVGIITAQKDVLIGRNLNVTGVSTFQSHVHLGDNDQIIMGGGSDLKIYHDGSNSYVEDAGTGALIMKGTTLRFRSPDNEKIINAHQNGSVDLFFDDSKKFETTNTGAVVTGILTATTFSGNLTGNVTGNVTGDLTGNLAGISSIAAISSSISDTAVDVFVYDTRKDSDGGAWRKRTQNTSWYNETLNTATRGSRKEFPAVAVLVLEAGKLTIYDGDDPDLPMWMVFNNTGSNISIFGRSLSTKTSVEMLNGLLVIGGSYSGAHFEAFTHINFISEKCQQSDNTGTVVFHKNISQRGETSTWTLDTSSFTIVNIVSVNDVAMTLLPNSKIDDTTGLPFPTIAVATNGGVTVIKDNNTVISTSGSSYIRKVEFTDDHGLNAIISNTGGANWACVYVNDIDTLNGLNYGTYNNWDGVVYRTKYDAKALTYKTASTNDTISGFIDLENRSSAISVPAIGGGLTLFEKSPKDSFDPDSGMVAFITTDYNTGYLHGDIKSAFLSDTDTTNVTGSELVTNGTFASDVSGWTTVTSTITYNSGAANIARNGGSGANAIYQNISGLTVGQKYLVSIKITALSNYVSVYFDPDGSDPLTEPITATATGTYTAIYTATQTSGKLSINATASSSATATVDDISMRVAEEDRSVNNNGLQVFGTITKSAVATGADLVGYSGFSSGNYLRYNAANMNFGTGDFSVSVWCIPSSDTTNEFILELDDASAGSNRFYFLVTNTTTKRLYLPWDADIAGSELIAGQWNHIVVGRKSGYGFVYVNNRWVSDGYKPWTTDFQGNGLGTIGNYSGGPTNGYAWSGSLALLRISGSVPTAEQVNKMYNDEKQLFQENAKCTLDGATDAVNALAFDDTTKLLHAGTSTGRNDFQRLRRINNTTTAVTTAISASDDLIAEQ